MKLYAAGPALIIINQKRMTFWSSYYINGCRKKLTLSKKKSANPEIILLFALHFLLCHFSFKTMCWTHLHEVLLQETVNPGLSHLHGPHLIRDVAALDEHHLQLHRVRGQMSLWTQTCCMKSMQSIMHSSQPDIMRQNAIWD